MYKTCLKASHGLTLLMVICVTFSESTAVFAQGRWPRLNPVSHSQADSPSELPRAGDVDRPALSLDDLERLALEHNPTILQAAWRVDRARGRHWQAGRYPNPIVAYQGTEIGNEGRAGQQGGYFSQVFVTAGKLRLDRAVAAQEIERTLFGRDAQRSRVLNDVRLRFYDVLGAQKRVTLSLELERMAKRGVELAEQRLKAGFGTLADVRQAEIDLVEIRITLADAKNREDAAWRRLTSMVGMPELEPAPLNGSLEADLPDLQWESSRQRLLATSPVLSAARARIQRARYQLRRERVQPIPNIRVQAGGQFDYATGDAVASVQIGIPIPVFNRNRGNIDAATAEFHRAQQELRRLELSQRDRLAPVFRQYRTARYRVERYQQDILPKGRQNLQLLTEGYEAGDFSFVRILTARRSFFERNLTYVDSLIELRKASILLTGLLLSGGLEEVPE